MIGLATVPPLPPGMLKSWSPTLFTDFGFHESVMKLSLLTNGFTTRGVAEFLVLETPEYGRGGLFVEVQQRHGLAANDLDLRLHVVGRYNARIGRNSASASSFNICKVAFICGTDRMAN